MGALEMEIIFITFIGLVCGQTQFQTPACTLPSLCRDGSIIDPRISGSGTPGAVGPTSTGSGIEIYPTGTGFPGSGAIGPPPLNPIGPPLQPNVGIVTTPCPPGYIRCTNVTCGTPSVQPGSQDGFATQNAFPWQVYLRNNNNLDYAGGGVLLDQYHVLTAAHKVTNVTSISIFVGVYNSGSIAGIQCSQYSSSANTQIQCSQVAQVWIHSSYNEMYLKNDVAILRLATPININTNAMPICLPPFGKSYIGLPRTSCVVSGWGQTSFNVDDAPTQTLKQVHVPIVTNQQCILSYNNILGAANTAAYLDAPNELCAGGEPQLDACTQDGGSPLVCYDTNTQLSLVGLVLWGKNCGQAGRYGVYLNVPAYLNWIRCTLQCIPFQNCSACPARLFS